MGNRGQENHSKGLRLGEIAGRSLSRLKLDTKETMSCGKGKNVMRQWNKLEITATLGSNHIFMGQNSCYSADYDNREKIENNNTARWDGQMDKHIAETLSALGNATHLKLKLVSSSGARELVGWIFE